MEDLYDACLIHGPGWFSEAMATEYPIVKLGEEAGKIDWSDHAYIFMY